MPDIHRYEVRAGVVLSRHNTLRAARAAARRAAAVMGRHGMPVIVRVWGTAPEEKIGAYAWNGHKVIELITIEGNYEW